MWWRRLNLSMLDKAIRYGKEKRKPYRNSKSFDRTCRNHGSCPYCENNRTYHNRKEEERTSYILKEDLS
jgi:hypothetical protein